MQDMTISRAMAKYVFGLNFQNLPENVLKQAKRVLLDMVACAIGGYKSEASEYSQRAFGKICDKKDINFKQNLRIAPFEPRERGVIQGTVDNIYGVETYSLEYYRMDDYVIVWCCKQ